MRNRFVRFAVAAIVTLPFLGLAAPVELKSAPFLNLEAARGMIVAAEKAVGNNKWAMTIAILDDGGNLIALDRMDGAVLASVEISQQKAMTSVLFHAPSKVFEDGVTKGSNSLLKLKVLPFEGGIPLMVGNKLVGAIGVSGGDLSSQDGKIAQAGAEWFAANVKTK